MKELPIEKFSVRWKGAVDPETGNQEDNPTKMTAEQFSALQKLISKYGFLQPVLHDKKLVIIDGAHRYWAAKAVGRETISGVLKDAKKQTSRALGIGMNRVRGELDLSVVAADFKEIIASTGWSPPQLSGLTGFSPEEISSMVESVVAEGEELLDDAAEAQDNLDEEQNTKPHVLEIEFADVADYKMCKRKLKKAAGKGKDLAQGLLNVLGESKE